MNQAYWVLAEQADSAPATLQAVHKRVNAAAKMRETAMDPWMDTSARTIFVCHVQVMLIAALVRCALVVAVALPLRRCRATVDSLVANVPKVNSVSVNPTTNGAVKDRGAVHLIQHVTLVQVATVRQVKSVAVEPVECRYAPEIVNVTIRLVSVILMTTPANAVHQILNAILATVAGEKAQTLVASAENATPMTIAIIQTTFATLSGKNVGHAIGHSVNVGMVMCASTAGANHFNQVRHAHRRATVGQLLRLVIKILTQQARVNHLQLANGALMRVLVCITVIRKTAVASLLHTGSRRHQVARFHREDVWVRRR